MNQRVAAIGRLLSDPAASEADKVRAEDRMISILKALVDASNKSLTYLIPKGSGPGTTETEVSTHDVIAEMVGRPAK